MRLTGPLLDRIVKAILHAFDRDDLVRVVRIYLDEDLETIVSGDKSYDMQVFALVRWAEKQTRVPELLYYLAKERPFNNELTDLAEEFDGKAFPPPIRDAAPVTKPRKFVPWLIVFLVFLLFGSAAATYLNWKSQFVPATQMLAAPTASRSTATEAPQRTKLLITPSATDVSAVAPTAVPVAPLPVAVSRVAIKPLSLSHLPVKNSSANICIDQNQQASSFVLDKVADAVARVTGCALDDCSSKGFTGFFIDPSGLILTTNQITAPMGNGAAPDSFLVETVDPGGLIPQPRYRARLVANHPEKNIALLAIYEDESSLSAVDPGMLRLPSLSLQLDQTEIISTAQHIVGNAEEIDKGLISLSPDVDSNIQADTSKLLKWGAMLGMDGSPVLVTHDNGDVRVLGVAVRYAGDAENSGLRLQPASNISHLHWLVPERSAQVTDVATSYVSSSEGDVLLQIDFRVSVLDMAGESIKVAAFFSGDVNLEPNLPNGTTAFWSDPFFSEGFLTPDVPLTITVPISVLEYGPQSYSFHLEVMDAMTGQTISTSDTYVPEPFFGTNALPYLTAAQLDKHIYRLEPLTLARGNVWSINPQVTTVLTPS